MTRAPSLATVRADVRAIEGERLRVSLRGVGNDLFAPMLAARELGAKVGVRLLVATDDEVIAASVIQVDGGMLELRLRAQFDDVPKAVTLRRGVSGGES